MTGSALRLSWTDTAEVHDVIRRGNTACTEHVQHSYYHQHPHGNIYIIMIKTQASHVMRQPQQFISRDEINDGSTKIATATACGGR